MSVKSTLVILIAFVMQMQVLYCQNNIIDLTPKMNLDLSTLIDSKEVSHSKANTLKPPLHPLWKHTKRLVKYPFDLAELKVCLQKSLIYLNNSEAALVLGKFSLFEYPIEKTYKSNLFKNKQYCQEYETNDSKLQRRLDRLQEYDPINSYTRHFAKALYYFHESEQLLNKDAPVFIIFIIQLAQFTENFNNIIDLDLTAYQNLSIELLNAAAIRGSILAQQLTLTEILNCIKIDEQDHNFTDILNQLMNTKLLDVIQNGSHQELINHIEQTDEYTKIKQQQQSNEDNASDNQSLKQDYIFISKKQYLQSQQQRNDQMIDDELDDEDLDTLHEENEELDTTDSQITKPNQQDLQETMQQLKQVNQIDEDQMERKQKEDKKEINEDKEDFEKYGNGYLKIKKLYRQLIGQKLNCNTTSEENYRILDQVIHKIARVVYHSDIFIGLDQNEQCISCKEALVRAAHILANNNSEQQRDTSSSSSSSENGDDQDEDIYLSDRLIFKNTEHTYQDLVQQNQVNPTNQAEEILRMKAALGDVVAQMQLGGQYYAGNVDNNIQQDHQQAFNYFQQAADRGQPQAMYNTGILISNGLGTPKNGTKAKDYYLKAIELGEENAYSGLGYLYSIGLDVPKNETKAAHYFEQAMLAGNEDSVVNLAKLYHRGFDQTPKNETKTIELMMSVVHKNPRAQIFLAQMKLIGKNIDLSCEDLLSYMVKKNKRDYKKDIFSERAIKKFKEEKYDDALIYSLFASFLGYESAHHNSAAIWSKLSKEQDRKRDVNSYLMCQFNDFELCKVLLLYKDAVMHRNESFVQVGHILYKGSKSFHHSYQYSFHLYNTSSYLPESLHSISYFYELGYYVEQNITKAIEINNLILLKTSSKQVSFNHFWPAIIRKVYLFTLYYFDIITALFK